MARKPKEVEPEEDSEQQEEEEYDENADEDFNPDEAAADDAASSSSSEDEESAPRATAQKGGQKGKKRKAPAAAELDELDSGDEATIREQRKKKRRKGEPDKADDDDESGGEGGLIKTRAQRLAEKVERKQKRRQYDGAVSIDVDSLWETLASVPVGRTSIVIPNITAPDETQPDGDSAKPPPTAAPPSDEHRLITIERHITYAGETTTITERVPLSSKAAQQYLAAHPEAAEAINNTTTTPSSSSSTPTRRPLVRPSLFEPNPTGTVKSVPPHKLRPRAPNRLDVQLAAQRAAATEKKRIERMTTVQKSAVDWRGFVEKQEGLKEELEVYGKSKQGFLAREAFLDRSAEQRELAGRAARGVVAMGGGLA